MKRLFPMVLALVFLLASCSAVREDNTVKYDETLLMQSINLEPSIKINPVLYFLNQAQTKLQAEAREISVPEDGVKEASIVEELIDGPVSETLYPVAKDFAMENVEVMPDVINVYLSLNKNKSEDEILNAKIAIAATLYDYSGGKSVNIFVNGMQAGYMGMPTGAVQKISNDLSEERLALQGKSTVENPDIQAVLYFLDSTESYLLPETRRLVFKDKRYIETLVEQLLRGPEDTYNHKPVLDSSIKLIQHEIVTEPDGKKIARLLFNKDPFAATTEFRDGKKMALAALTYTIVGFMPDISGVEIVVGSMRAASAVHTPSMYEDLIGSSITIYLPGSAAATLLVGVPRVIGQRDASDPHMILSTLMKGRSDTEEEQELYPPMPLGVTMEDVNDIYISHDIMVVDFDGGINEKLTGVSKENEFVMYFSIVNTLTSYEGIRRVQFLLDGERVEHLGGGGIDIIDPLIKNPGIVKYMA